MKGKIAVFIGQLNQAYSIEMAIPVAQAAKERGYHIDIFSEFGSYGQNYLHAAGERNIIRLPYLEDYDGVIIAPDTFGVPEMEKQLDILLLSKTTKPVVSIRQEKDCFYSVQIDNRAAMARMTEHFVKDHGYRKVCFMKGRADLKDAQERLQGYLDVMEKYQIPVTEYMLFQGDYWRNHGTEAVDWFLSGPEMPEAIICANDFMAISVLMALKERNLRIPEDIAVAGLDDVEEARYLEPAITSVRMPCQEMSRQAVYLIDKIHDGGKSEQIVRIPAEMVLRKSCGCDVEENGHWAEHLYNRNNYLSAAIMHNGFLNADYENCDNVEELFSVAYQYSNRFIYDEIYICLCETVDENGERILEPQHYTENVILRAVLKSGEGMTLHEEKFPRREILPEKYRRGDDVLYFFPMHHKNRCIGYLAMYTPNPGSLREFFNCWTTEMCSCLDKVLLYEENKSLQEFRKLSTVDDLTGLFNRRKLEQELSKKLVIRKSKEVEFYVFSLDMDGLKMINDTYGHLEGDVALCTFGQILVEAAGEIGTCFRVGGDEFMILASTGDENKVKEIAQAIEDGTVRYNKVSGKPYQVVGSIGYAKYNKNEEVSNCIRRADINMYANKMAMKRGRR